MTTTISPQAETVLAHRYYLKDDTSEPLEDSDGLFRRVAKAIASIEDQYLTLKVEKDLLEIYWYFSTIKALALACTKAIDGGDQENILVFR